MSSIADLMKFRFQRRGLRNGELQSSPLSTTSQKSEAEPCPSGSTQSDSSDSDSDESDIHTKSSNSSPWLSKKAAIEGKQNGVQNVKASVKQVQSGNRREDPLSSDTETEVDSSSLANLQEMFPDQNKKVLQEALQQTLDFDAAVDHVIFLANQKHAPKRKRIRRMDDDSDSSEPGPAAKKHVRQLSSDDNCSDQQTEEEKADFLAEAFPNIDREVHYVTPSKNMGSIKAFKAARGCFFEDPLQQHKVTSCRCK
ncbi:hypothetical protein NP493_419g07002 [Ridgeia piscesae]|uniref:CUE domain-containing protein n=1 Tax=Ridgeia piscesae TaxID=27915 RepID=A0AAD9L1E3_RIDPI|nr:hypothetical protein NP493_419g07002 [Ridgeia piscesae]